MRDLTNGNITRNILAMSWPTMIAMLLHVGFNIVDTIFVGRLGPEAIAAVSVVFPAIFLMFAIGGGLFCWLQITADGFLDLVFLCL
jgi:Na+-driven multidrug efflux pump